MALEDGFDIQISGIEEACAMLENVPKDMRRVAFARALTAAAVPVVSSLRKWTPVQDWWTTDPGGIFRSPGSLQEGIKTNIFISEQGGRASVNFGKYGPIALWLEYGHRIVAHGATWSDRMKNYAGKILGKGEVPSKPFVRPAAAESAQAAVEAFTESLTETLVTGTTWASVGETAIKAA